MPISDITTEMIDPSKAGGPVKKALDRVASFVGPLLGRGFDPIDPQLPAGTRTDYLIGFAKDFGAQVVGPIVRVAGMIHNAQTNIQIAPMNLAMSALNRMLPHRMQIPLAPYASLEKDPYVRLSEWEIAPGRDSVAIRRGELVADAGSVALIVVPFLGEAKGVGLLGKAAVAISVVDRAQQIQAAEGLIEGIKNVVHAANNDPAEKVSPDQIKSAEAPVIAALKGNVLGRYSAGLIASAHTDLGANLSADLLSAARKITPADFTSSSATSVLETYSQFARILTSQLNAAGPSGEAARNVIGQLYGVNGMSPEMVSFLSPAIQQQSTLFDSLKQAFAVVRSDVPSQLSLKALSSGAEVLTKLQALLPPIKEPQNPVIALVPGQASSHGGIRTLTLEHSVNEQLNYSHALSKTGAPVPTIKMAEYSKTGSPTPANF